MRSRIIGVLIFLVIIVIAVYVGLQNRPGKTGGPITVKGFIGSEKSGLLDDPEIKAILWNKYRITVDYSKAGSIEMVKGNMAENSDFLWPSSQVALEIYRLQRSNKSVKSEIIFNTPLCLYSWDIVANALEKKGIVTHMSNVYYIVDLPALFNLVLKGSSWSDIGLSELYGKMGIFCTDPTLSNSGMMFAGLLANVLHRDVVDRSSVTAYLPIVKKFFVSQGYMEHSTGILFEQFLRTGVGQFPLIVGYENLIVEFSAQYKKEWPSIRDKIRLLYPVPTAWSSHPLIVLTSKGARFLEALKDPKIQTLAWEKHGFRTGLMGIQNDPSLLGIVGIPAGIRKVVPMPSADVMEMIIDYLK